MIIFESMFIDISKDFKSSDNNYELKSFSLDDDISFSKWEDVDNFLREYSDRMGFNCHRKLISMDVNGNVTLTKFRCTEVNYDPEIPLTKFSRFLECNWYITFCHSK